MDEALKMLASDSDGKLLAGGQSLVPSMKLRLAAPSSLVDISSLPELKGIKEEGANLVIGAGVTHSEIEKSAAVKKHAACLAQCASLIGDVMIRNRGTIGGSVAHADPAADYPGVLVALGAKIKLKSAKGSRDVDASQFFTGFFETALNEGEIVHQIIVPSHAGWKSGYVKFPNPASRYPIVGCAVLLKMNGATCEDARVGFSGVSYAAFRDTAVEKGLKGKSLDAAAAKAAGNAAAEGCEILEDSSAGTDYRKAMAKQFATRGIQALL